MPSTTGLDLILELWNTHGIFALGWIFFCFACIDSAIQRKSKDELFREYVSAVQTANAQVIPLLTSSTQVMTHVVAVIDSAVDRAGARDATLGRLEGQLDIVIRRAIAQDNFIAEAEVAGSERARKTALKVHTDDNQAGRGRTRPKPLRKPTNEK